MGGYRYVKNELRPYLNFQLEYKHTYLPTFNHKYLILAIYWLAAKRDMAIVETTLIHIQSFRHQCIYE